MLESLGGSQIAVLLPLRREWAWPGRAIAAHMLFCILDIKAIGRNVFG